jgi:hypothetical protein
MASNGASLLPNFLVPEGVQRSDGESDAFDLGDLKGGLLLLTLGITRIIEQESLDVSIWGSADGANWGEKPLAAFPQKFYCGTYTIMLDLSKHPEAQFLKAKWKMGRWGRGDPKPLFGFYLYAERVSSEVGVPAGGSG